MSRYVIGADIGGSSVKLGLFQEKGALICKWEIPTRLENKGAYILQDIADSLKKKLQEQGIEKETLIGFGIAVPGPILEDGTVNKCANLGWDVFSVEEEMAKLISIKKIRALNDANAAALGEMWQGSGAGHKNMVMLTLGTGVGGGIISDGKILTGSFGAAGEIGHMQVCFHEEEVCGCGKRGCLEQYAGARGMIQVAKKKLLESGRSSLLQKMESFSAKEICDAAKAGDALALEVMEEACDKLGRALSYISAVTDPELYVIGGGISRAGSYLTDKIEDYFRRYAFHSSKNAEIRLAKLGNDAGIYGAARMVL